MASDSTPNLGPATGTGTSGTTPIADSPGNSTPQTQGQGQGQGQGQAEAQAQAQGQGQGQTQGRPGGAPTRVYVNEKIVPYLLDGMKTVAREQYVICICCCAVWGYGDRILTALDRRILCACLGKC